MDILSHLDPNAVDTIRTAIFSFAGLIAIEILLRLGGRGKRED